MYVATHCQCCFFPTEMVCRWFSEVFYRWSFTTCYYGHTDTDVLCTIDHICDCCSSEKNQSKMLSYTVY